MCPDMTQPPLAGRDATLAVGFNVTRTGASGADSQGPAHYHPRWQGVRPRSAAAALGGWRPVSPQLVAQQAQRHDAKSAVQVQVRPFGIACSGTTIKWVAHCTSRRECFRAGSTARSACLDLQQVKFACHPGVMTMGVCRALQQARQCVLCPPAMSLLAAACRQQTRQTPTHATAQHPLHRTRPCPVLLGTQHVRLVAAARH